MYTDIIFDLDGTINESGDGIKASLRHSMKECGKVLDENTNLDFIIGPPLSSSYAKLGIPEDEIDKLVDSYRRHYKQTGIYINSVYPGMVELLKELKGRGLNLHIATSKPGIMTEIILDYFDLKQYFTFIGSASEDLNRQHKTEVLAHTISNIDAPKENMVMIGDRRDDMQAALINGIDSIGVEYGYGSYDELMQAGAKYIAKSVEDILNYL